MDSRITEVVLSTVLVSIAFYVLWPVGDVPWQWWTVLPETLRGDGPLLSILLVLSCGTGVVALKVTGIRAQNLAIGGFIAFLLSMTVIEVLLSPNSPAHWILYGTLLVGIVAGGFLQQNRQNPKLRHANDRNSV